MVKYYKFLGLGGLISGIFVGCFIRDEYNYSSYDKIDELNENYSRNDFIINNDIKKYRLSISQLKLEQLEKKKQSEQNKSEII